jgi:thiol-disulfide isomerase/thioredoxin
LSENSQNEVGGNKPSGLKWALWGVAAVGVAAVVYIIVQAAANPGPRGDLKSVAKGEMAKLVVPAEATAAPATTFYDGEGKPLRLADFKGKVVVLNIWATWCAPCKIEMPALAKLQTEYSPDKVVVIPVSVDGDRDVDTAKQFIAQNAPLGFYRDPKMKLPYDLKPVAVGMPTTIIFDAEGVEKGRLAGGADWAGKDAKAVIDKVLAAG